MGHVVNPHLFRLNYVVFWSGSLVTKKKYSMYFDVNSLYVLKYLRQYFKDNNFIDLFGLYNINLKIIYLNFFLKIFLVFKQHRMFRRVIKRKIRKKLLKNYKYCIKKVLIKFNNFKYFKKKKLNYLNSKNLNFFLNKKFIKKLRSKKRKKIDENFLKFLKKKYDLKKKHFISLKKKYKLNVNVLNFKDYTNLTIKKKLFLRKKKHKSINYKKKGRGINKVHMFKKVTFAYKPKKRAKSYIKARKSAGFFKMDRKKKNLAWAEKKYYKILNKKFSKTVLSKKYTSQLKRKIRRPKRKNKFFKIYGRLFRMKRRHKRRLRKGRVILKRIENFENKIKRKTLEQYSFEINKVKTFRQNLDVFNEFFPIEIPKYEKRLMSSDLKKNKHTFTFVRPLRKLHTIESSKSTYLNNNQIYLNKREIHPSRLDKYYWERGRRSWSIKFNRLPSKAYLKHREVCRLLKIDEDPRFLFLRFLKYDNKYGQLEKKQNKVYSKDQLWDRDRKKTKEELQNEVRKRRYKYIKKRTSKWGINISKPKLTDKKIAVWQYKKFFKKLGFKKFYHWKRYKYGRPWFRKTKQKWLNILSKPELKFAFRTKFLDYLFENKMKTIYIKSLIKRKNFYNYYKKEKNKIKLRIKKIKNKKISINLYSRKYLVKVLKYKKKLKKSGIKISLKQIEENKKFKNLKKVKRKNKKINKTLKYKKKLKQIKKLKKKKRMKKKLKRYRFKFLKLNWKINRIHKFSDFRFRKKFKSVEKYERYKSKFKKKNLFKLEILKFIKNKRYWRYGFRFNKKVKKFMLKARWRVISKRKYAFMKKMRMQQRRFARRFNKKKNKVKNKDLDAFIKKIKDEHKLRKRRRELKKKKRRSQYIARYNKYINKYNKHNKRVNGRIKKLKKKKKITKSKLSKVKKKKNFKKKKLKIKEKKNFKRKKLSKVKKKKIFKKKRRKFFETYVGRKKILRVNRRLNKKKQKLKRDYFNFFLNKFLILKYYVRISNLKFKFNSAFNILFAYKINVNILIFIKKYWGTLITADLIADLMILRLLQKYKINAIMISILRFLKRKLRKKVLYGFAILIMGRFSRRDRAVYSWYKRGPFTRSSKLVYIDYANRRVALKFSTCSFKINLIKSLGFKKKLEIFR